MTPADAGLTELAQTVPECHAVITQLIERVKLLEERVKLDSNNSSKPPSSNGPGALNPSRRRASGRKRGGQPGHVRVHGVSPSTIRARRALIWQGWAAGSLDQPVGAAATEPVRGIRLGGAVLAMNAWTALCMNSHRSRPWRRQVS